MLDPVEKLVDAERKQDEYGRQSAMRSQLERYAKILKIRVPLVL